MANKLGIAYYNSELITMTAKESGYAEEYVADSEEEITNGLLHDFYILGTQQQFLKVICRNWNTLFSRRKSN
ncbi:hypothetical protein [Desulfotomaculum sp. 1211_IL3151]|uniref:hypothetical protein n=1 Tax=Desulfotomaculum sp. 1211_IL3151 TaxID=3084055 RepID=UPI003FA5F04D